jgi:glycosyltransferase involved in cell wall biosynthesis
MIVMKKVSILIPAYNAAQYLPQALDSVLAQTFKDFEIILIDDGSKDNTRAIVEEFQKQCPDKIRYIYQENQGLSGARNAGLQQAKGEFIALLDADDMWCPERLEFGIKAIEADPSIGLVHANITRISTAGEFLSTPRRDKRFLSGFIFEHLFLRKADIACPTVLFRRSCCDSVGMFDSKLGYLGCEDRDLWLRIAKSYKIVYIDKVLARYRVRRDGMSHNVGNMFRARVYIIDKYFPEGQGHTRLRNLALAKIFRDSGDEFLLRRDFVEARKQYRRALAHDPFLFWARVNLLKTFLRERAR